MIQPIFLLTMRLSLCALPLALWGNIISVFAKETVEDAGTHLCDSEINDQNST